MNCVNVVTKQPRTQRQFIFLSSNIHKNSQTKIYNCNDLVNIRNIDVKYSHCGPIHYISNLRSNCQVQNVSTWVCFSIPDFVYYVFKW